MPQVECGFPGQVNGLIQYGPTLQVRIGFDPGSIRGGDPNLPDTDYHALVDTGAGEVNVHLAQILIPSLDIVISGRFTGVHLYAGGQPHGALIGRTLLQHVTMIYNGITGSVIIALPDQGPEEPSA